jgi:hypothetical protein
MATGALQLTVGGRMARITVDVRALEEVARSLSDCVARIDVAARLVNRGAGGTPLGGSRLDGAAEDFCTQWERGLIRVADAADVVSRRVRDAATLYSDVDARVAATMLPTTER